MSPSLESPGRRYGLSLILFILLVVTFASHEGSLVVHQVLGVLFMAALGVHLAWHGRWLWAIARRFAGPLPARTRFAFLVDAVGALALLGTVVGGLAISSWSPWTAGPAFALSHHVLVKVFLLAALLHLAQHAGWMWRQTAERLAGEVRRKASGEVRGAR